MSKSEAASSCRCRVRNVVFDMGEVLVHFDGAYFASFYVDCTEDARLIDQALFSSPEWALLDAGAISEATLERLAADRLPQRLVEPMRASFATWHEHQPVLEEANQLVLRLHEAGFGCYLLSNAGVRFWRQKDRIPCLAVMDGWVVSSWEHLMKPDPAIYRTLCERFGLAVKECVFVDDRPENVRGAEVAGMMGHLYTGAEELERYLHALGLVF